jgi:hypothetical protein
MSNQRICLTLLSATIALVPLGNLKFVNASEQISDRANDRSSDRVNLKSDSTLLILAKKGKKGESEQVKGEDNTNERWTLNKKGAKFDKNITPGEQTKFDKFQNAIVDRVTQPAPVLHERGDMGARIGNATIEIIDLITKIKGDDNKKRAAFTQQTIADLAKKYKNYNFVITHHQGSKAEGPSVAHRHIELPMAVGSAGYEIFGSPKGKPFKFLLNGDGGNINWAFRGDFNRDGNNLTAK